MWFKDLKHENGRPYTESPITDYVESSYVSFVKDRRRSPISFFIGKSYCDGGKGGKVNKKRYSGITVFM